MKILFSQAVLKVKILLTQPFYCKSGFIKEIIKSLSDPVSFLLLLINIHSYFLESDLVGIYTASYILTSGSVVQRSFKPTKTSFWNISLFKYSPAASTLENPCKT